MLNALIYPVTLSEGTVQVIASLFKIFLTRDGLCYAVLFLCFINIACPPSVLVFLVSVFVLFGQPVRKCCLHVRVKDLCVHLCRMSGYDWGWYLNMLSK